jgi:hypothetical protein
MKANQPKLRFATRRRIVAIVGIAASIATIVGVIVGILNFYLTIKHISPSEKLRQATSGSPFLNDPLTDNLHGANWSETSNEFGTCTFKANAYYVTSSSPSGLKTCLSESFIVSDFTFQAQVEIHQGTTGGLILRWSQGAAPFHNFYYFYVKIDGSYGFSSSVYQNKQYTYTVLQQAPSQAILKGPDETNQLTVIASANMFDLYVNGQFLNTTSDPSNSAHSMGEIGFTSGFGSSEVVFSNMKLWRYPPS